MQPYVEKRDVSYATAAEAIRLAIEFGAEDGVKVVVAVADTSMSLVAFGRTDGSTPHSAETSQRKAATSASTRKRTAHLPEQLGVAMALGTGSLLTRIDGGFPLSFDGVHVGGLGVAGGRPDQDAVIAAKVLEQLGADPIPE